MNVIEKISVVMCTYNGEKYIRQQLDSILKQTYPIYEIIINDDISTDGTVDIIKEYMIRYDNIHLFVNSKRLGVHPNFMAALVKASGDYIAISDQDDIWELTKIEKQMACIKGYALCFSLSRSFGDGWRFMLNVVYLIRMYFVCCFILSFLGMRCCLKDLFCLIFPRRIM